MLKRRHWFGLQKSGSVWEHLVYPHPWMGVWVNGWLCGSVGQWVGSGQMTNNCISLDLIKIFQFCLKVYDL